MRDDAHRGAVLLDLVEIGLDGSFAVIVLPFLRMTLKGLLLRCMPESRQSSCLHATHAATAEEANTLNL